MSVLTWLRFVSASSSDTATNRHSDTRRSASSSNRFGSVPARAVAGGLRRAVTALLLGVPLLLGLAAGTQAQLPDCSTGMAPCKTPGTLEFKGFRTKVPSTASNGVDSGFDGTYEVDEGNTLYGKIMLNGGQRAIDKMSAVVVVRASGGTATRGQDYQGISMSPVVHRDYAHTWFSLRIPADGIADDAETFTLEFQDVNDADFKTNGVVDTGTTYPTAEITIRDYTSTDPNDFIPTELIWLSKGEHNVTEGGAVRGEVHISRARGVDTTISLTERSGTATSGTDYNAGPYSVTIPAGKTSAAFWLHTMQDEDLELQEAFTLEIDKTSLPTGYEVDTGSGRHEDARVKIDDDEYQLSFALSSYTVREDAGELVATLKYSRPLPKDSTVKFTYTDLSAIGWDPTQPRPAAYDYTQQNAFPIFLELPAGTEEFTFRVPIHNDNVYEQNEAFKIRGVASEVPFGVPDPSVDVIIRSTDPEVDFQASAFPAHEGRDAVVTFRVVERGTDDLQTLRKPTTLHVAATGRSTATAGTDYAAGPWTLTIPKGASKGVLRIPVHSDSASDDGETIKLEIKTSGRMLADQSGTALSGHDHIRIRHGSGWASGAATVTIKDGGGDAKPPMVSIAAGADVTEGTNATFTLTATPAPPVDIDVSIHVDGVRGGHVADEDRGLQTVSIPSSTGTFDLEVPTQVTGRAGEVRVILMAPKGVSDDWTPDYRVHRESTVSLKVGAGSGSPGTDPGDQVPDTEVSNVQASVIDDASATVTWDAVEHATSYQVEWEGDGQQFSSAGALPGITGTTATIDHQAQEMMTLAIKVIPAYVDDNGDTRLLDDLAGTTTLDVGPAGGGQDGAPLSACVSDAQWNTVEDYYASNSGKAPNYGENWYRVLIAYAQARTDKTLPAWAGATARPTTPYTVADAQTSETVWSGWTPVREVLACVEAANPPRSPLQAPEPELSLSAGPDVDEGDSATFTVHAGPAPESDLTVRLTVAQSGDWLDAPGAGSRTVTLPAGAASANLTVATVDDGADEDDGSVSVTIDTGTGYTVAASPNDAASVAVRDDDEPLQAPEPELSLSAGPDVDEGDSATFTVHAEPAPQSDLTVRLTVAQSGDWLDAPGAGSRTLILPAGAASANLTVATVDDGADEEDGSVSVAIDTGTGYTVAASPNDAASVTVRDDDAPPPPSTTMGACVSDAQWNTVEDYYESNSGKAPNYGENWYRVLIAYGQERTDKTLPDWVGATAKPTTPYTVADAQASETVWSGWRPVREVLACVEAANPPPAPRQAPEVTVSAGGDVTEGAVAHFTISANPAPSSPLRVEVSVSQRGDYAAVGTTGAQTVTVPTSGNVTLDITTVDDRADEPDGSISVSIDAGTGYTVGSSHTDTVNVADDDAPPPVTPSSTMGACVSDAQWNTVEDYYASNSGKAPNYGRNWYRVLIAYGQARTDKTLPDWVGATARPTTPYTVTDAQTSETVWSGWRPVRKVLECLAAAGGGSARAAASGSAPLPSVSVGDASVEEGPNAQLVFTVRLSEPAAQTIRVSYGPRDVTATRGEDYAGGGGTLVFNPAETTKQVAVTVYDDAHDEGEETLELVLTNPRGATLADGIGTGTIRNTDPLPSAFLGRFGRGLAEQAVDGITARLKANRTQGFSGQFLGQALSAGHRTPDGETPGQPPALARDRAPAVAVSGAGMNGTGMATLPGHDNLFPADSVTGHAPPSTRTVTLAEALAGSSFTYTPEADEAGGSFGLWGRGMHSTFSGAEGALNVDGELTTGLIGADYARQDWQAGLAVLLTGGEGSFRGNTGKGTLDTSLTAFVPYAAKQAGRLEVWGAAGYGFGEMTLSETVSAVSSTESLSTDLGWQMAAGGLRSNLGAFLGEAGPDLTLVGDAQWTRTTSEKTLGLAGSEAQTTRVRVGVEGGWSLLFAEQSLRPTIEAGVRYDGGDADTGLGIELGAGLRWEQIRWGLAVDIEGRTLVAHEDKSFKHSGFSASLTFDPDLTSLLGPSLTLTHRLGGPSSGGLDALFAEQLPGSRSGHNAGGHWQAEAAYGMAVFRGRFIGTPTLGYTLSGQAGGYRLGWKLSPVRTDRLNLSAEVAATRNELPGAAADHGIGLDLRSHW